jgi:hypothetical protein
MLEPRLNVPIFFGSERVYYGLAPRWTEVGEKFLEGAI